MRDLSSLHRRLELFITTPARERLRGKLDLVAMLIALRGCSQWMYDEQLLPNR